MVIFFDLEEKKKMLLVHKKSIGYLFPENEKKDVTKKKVIKDIGYLFKSREKKKKMLPC